MTKRRIVTVTTASLECTLVLASLVVAVPFFVLLFLFEARKSAKAENEAFLAFLKMFWGWPGTALRAQ